MALVCLGLLNPWIGAGLLPAAAGDAPSLADAPMTVTLVRSDSKDCATTCAEWLALTGQIRPQTPSLLRNTLERLGQRSVPILINSPGGVVEAAMTMGQMIRQRHLDVAVADTALTECMPADRTCLARRRTGERAGFIAGGIAVCASACTLVLAAGTDRSVGQNGYVGVHQIVNVQTVKRVMNRFRIMRRIVDGRVVEVSRTLIASTPISSYTVKAAAPSLFYSKVDRYLLGMGITESIMPLMRATPPDGIHWMRPVELGMTGIANDITDARTIVARSVLPRNKTSYPPEPAFLTLADGSVQVGTIIWRNDRTNTLIPDPAMLEADISIPARNMRGSLSIARNTDPDRPASFIVALHLADAGQTASSTLGAPMICGTETCAMSDVLRGKLKTWGAEDYAFWVAPQESDRLLSALRDGERLSIPVQFIGGGSGQLAAPLSGTAREAILDWQQWCCGLFRAASP